MDIFDAVLLSATPEGGLVDADDILNRPLSFRNVNIKDFAPLPRVHLFSERHSQETI
jgi:hypothetical protein